ncbi:hypothetical protein H6CHR_00259 [Variovorax sp. PBL-H6]|uniref:hypothetical protein n=1 Tax=Variovorax sp. PBL-H6 TaxID=434009 RepID=UPI0013193424|nr:hypothetical protein [Variovorax sp. PBL-H6]VTU15524.1 hypothetical protein H6CHR_00259 [Variovorax sp. PBL-H6]
MKPLSLTPSVRHIVDHGDSSTSRTREGTPRGGKLVKRSAVLFDTPAARALARSNADERGFLEHAEELKASDLFPPAPDDDAAHQVESRQAVSFGIDLQTLKEQKTKGEAAFDRHYQLAKRLETKKARSKRYEKIALLDRDGKPRNEFEVVRTKETGVQRFAGWQTKKGAAVQKAVNRTRDLWRELAGTERKYGSNYLSTEGTEGLVTGAKVVPLENAGAALGGIAQADRIVGAASAGLDPPAIAAGAGVVGNTLGLVAPVLVAANAVAATVAVSSLMSDRDKANADLLHSFKDARRYVDYLERATPEESDLFLDFDEAAQKLFSPTRQERANMAAAQAGAANQAGVQPLAAGVLAGTAITHLAAPALAISGPGALVLAPVAAVGAAIDVYKAYQERQGQLSRKEQAELRKTAMEAVLEANPGHSEYALLAGIVQGLGGWQDKLVDQSEWGESFAEAHLGTAGGTLGGMASLTVAGGLVLGGVLTAPLLGPVAVLAAAPGAVWGGVSARRTYVEHRIEHKSKWRQRAARVLGFELSREALEENLAEDRRLNMNFQEGEYLPAEERFAGGREMLFDARNNEYLGLHALALRVQDLVREGRYDADSPFIQLLHVIGIDAVRLLAICKAASARPADMQLDYIQSRIAPRLDMKLRMQGELRQQALPHVSHFLGHFRRAVSTVRARYETGNGSADLHAEIRKELAAFYPDAQAGLQAFDTAISAFLAKTQPKNLPETPFLKILKGFANYSAGLQAARGESDGPVKQRAAEKERAMKEINALVEELESFASAEQADAIRLTQP